MGCYNFLDTPRVNTVTNFTQKIFRYFSFFSDNNIANFEDDNRPCIYPTNTDDVIESLEQTSLSLIKWFEHNTAQKK